MSPAGSPNRLRKPLLLVSSVVLALAACILTYEAVQHARYRRWKAGFDNDGWLGRLTVSSSNATLMWEYKPYGRYADARQVIETSRHGFRDADYETTARPDGVERIAFVGDSITLGLFVAAEQTFVERLEALANRENPEPRVQTMNFGVDGYNGLQVLELLRARALEFEPQRVVYVLALNDFDFDDASGAKILYFRAPSSFFLRDLGRAVRRLRGVEYHRYHFTRRRDAVFDDLIETRDLLRDRGIDFHVALMPVFGRDSAHFTSYPHRETHDEIRAFLEEEGFQVIDLLEPLAASGLPAMALSYDVWHPNPEGHRLIAESLLAPLGFPPPAEGPD
jgi:lysophospholipase L1-like esterase